MVSDKKVQPNIYASAGPRNWRILCRQVRRAYGTHLIITASTSRLYACFILCIIGIRSKGRSKDRIEEEAIRRGLRYLAYGDRDIV